MRSIENSNNAAACQDGKDLELGPSMMVLWRTIANASTLIGGTLYEGTATMARADIHCHSCYSDQPIHWLFRKLGARESYTPVEELYRRQKKLGMDFVTITDHNRIDGALQLAEQYGDCFVGCEFTVRFPRQPAEVHLCVYDLNEEQFHMGHKVAGDVFDFADYFREQGLLVTVPHPLHCNRGRLTCDHFEQLLLLFDYFEEINGLQMASANQMQREFFARLTPDLLDRLAKKHGIEPLSQDSWRKGLLGGSDDHSSFFLGRCWTEVSGATTWQEFLQGIRDKRSTAHGQSMTALAFSQATQSTWINAILDHYCKPGSFDDRLYKLVSRVQPQRRWWWFRGTGAETATTTAGGERKTSLLRRFVLKRYLRFRLVRFLQERKIVLAGEAVGDCDCAAMEAPFFISAGALARFKEQVTKLVRQWRDTELLFDERPGSDLQEETFRFITSIFNSLYRYSISEWLEHMQRGNIPEAFARLSLLVPGILPAVPYVMGYKHFYYDQRHLCRIGERYRLPGSPASRPEKWGWFTDTLIDVNGAAAIVRKYTDLAQHSAVSITAITSHPQKFEIAGRYVNFPPLFHFPLPEYELMTMAVPSILDVLHHCEREQYTRLIISSPGPVGFMGMWVADLLNIPVSGIYHTDLPAFVGRLTDDAGLEQLTWRLISIFYSRMERVYVLSDSYRYKLRARGIKKKRIRTFAKGINIDLFGKGQGESFRRRWQLGNRPLLLYVGRVSREKELDLLISSFLLLKKRHESLALAIVGDGPFLGELRNRFDHRDDIILPGFLSGEELADAYGAGDIFTFPSTTDTYGTVLLEAQAAGLPAVVSDAGGPKEVIVAGKTGLVTKGGDLVSFTSGVEQLLDDKQLRQRMGKSARAHVAGRTWQKAFEDFIGDHLAAPAPPDIAVSQTVAEESLTGVDSE